MYSRNIKAKIPTVKVHSDSSGSLSDVKDSSGSDSSRNITAKLNLKEGKPKLAPKARVVSSRYKEAAIKATSKDLSNSSDSPTARSRLDRTGGKVSTLAPGSTRSPSFLNPGKGAPGKSNLRFHSTAVNNSTFFEKTDLSSLEEFSTTIVGNQNRFPRNKVNSNNSLTHLSDISEICPTTASKAAGNSDETNASLKNYTEEDIKKEFLEYLTWAYIDKRSEEAFEKQVNEAQKQIAFLTQLVEQEEDETSEASQKSNLLNQYEKTSHNHELIEDELLKLNETVEPSKNAIKDLARHLELQMNQIKLENIYLPSDEAAYKELVTEALRENYDTLKDLNWNLRDSGIILQSAAALYEDVVEEAEKIESCLFQGEKVACLAIQEASLKLSQRDNPESIPEEYPNLSPPAD